MTRWRPSRPLPTTWSASREAFATADLLGPVAGAALARRESVPARRAAGADGSALASLVRLFLLQDVLDDAEVAAALPVPPGSACSPRPAGRPGPASRSGRAFYLVSDLACGLDGDPPPGRP